MRRIRIIAALTSLLVLGFACTAETPTPVVPPIETPTTARPTTTTTTRPLRINGWTPALRAEARRLFFGGYGAEDAFGRCVFNWIVKNYSPSQVNNADQDTVANQALVACGDLL